MMRYLIGALLILAYLPLAPIAAAIRVYQEARAWWRPEPDTRLLVQRARERAGTAHLYE